jgi:hypothetical protein
VPDHVKQFLTQIGVADQPHSGRTLLDHCEGVYRLLREHGETVALAGALHSVYGTVYYTPRYIPTREQVRTVIGTDAERLVYLFCTLERKQISQLGLMAQANALEQRL